METKMRNQDFRDMPEYRAATGFPLAIIFLSMLGIGGYLIGSGTLTDTSAKQARVYVPLAAAVVPINR
ncbi:hypothetical protein [Rhizobium tubonense]|nr:hypothetical protein [Rhizobium tubonense]